MMANLLRAAVMAAVLAACAAFAVAHRMGATLAGVGLVLGLLAALPTVLALEVVLMHRVNRRCGGRLPGHDRHVEAPPPVRMRDLVRAWWGEVLASLGAFAWRQPFRSRAVPDVPVGTLPSPGAGTGAARGVVLVHGYCCNRGLWNPWIEQFRGRGVPCLAVDLEPVFGSIDAYAPIVEAAVRQLQRDTGQPPVLVGHSMGGLAIRAWMRHAGPTALDRVHHVVTIGTPHHGTWLGRAGHTVNARQMALDSDWLRGLATAEDPASYRRFTCFWSHCDNIVFPASSATLPGADNRHVVGVAHVDLIHPAAVIDAVLSWVQTRDIASPVHPGDAGQAAPNDDPAPASGASPTLAAGAGVEATGGRAAAAAARSAAGTTERARSGDAQPSRTG